MSREDSLLIARVIKPRLEERVEQSRQAIRSFLALCRRPYLAWSGGKDSTLMLWIARQIEPDIECIYFDAESCLPDTAVFMACLVEKWHLNFRAVKTTPILDVLERYGLDNPRIDAHTLKATVRDPIRRLREEGYDGALVGVRASESFWRAFNVARKGDLRWHKEDAVWVCWPLARWTLQQVWAATDFWDIPYSPDYDKTLFRPREENRTSYWAGETYRTYGRYVWLKKYYPGLFNELVRRIPEVARYV